MQRLGNISGSGGTALTGLTGGMIVAALVTVGLLCASSSNGQAQTQSVATRPLAYEYEVISVKPCKPGITGGYTMNTPDGYTARGMPLIIFVDYAYGIMDDERLAGGSGWISSERFDIDAKMDSSVAEALEKMSKDDRVLARQQMLQALLADRFKLTVHRETKELSVFTLVIAKNGFKLKQAKPDDTYPNGLKGADGRVLSNAVRLEMSAGGLTLTGQAVSFDYLARTLSQQLRRIVVDKTGLAGTYDFTLHFMPEQGGLQTEPENPSLPASADTNGPSLFTAVQEQLGLKLESGKSPVEIIVIDHVERPSGN
jgi:uncharacterized protein (TIGR03435 family)